jgi:aryl-alcohol dehydrogenase-like predicted oxidoreductase
MAAMAAGGAVLGPVARRAGAFAEAVNRGNPTETRTLGETGIKVMTVGIGMMITRDGDILRYAVDHGINYVDTADCYMGGENERIVGRALRGIRDKVVLASKVHIMDVPGMIRSVEKSLRSLNVEAIDIMQLHGISSEGEVTDGRAREALQKLMDQGKIRVPGVTTHGGQETVLRAVRKHGFYKTVLVAYNFRSDTGIKTSIKTALGLGEGIAAAIADAAASGIGVIAMKTQAGGYPVEGGGPSPHQAALAWVLSNPGVATTIPSMVSYAQVDENLKASGMRLSWRGIKTLSRYEEVIGDRHCGLCGECAGRCPNGVDVAGVLRSLTYFEGYGQVALARDSYRGLGDTGASACSSCSECVVPCRLGLAVGRLAGKAHTLLA